MVYQIPKLIKIKEIKHAFSQVKDGNMADVILGESQDEEKVLENRNKFLEKAGFEIDKTVCMWVTHGNDVAVADPKLAGISMKDRDHAVQCDGLITDKKGLNLFLLVADCIPLILFDPVKKILGILHVSRINIEMNVIEKFINIIKTNYASDTKDFLIGIGPTTRKESFIFQNLDKIDKSFWGEFVSKNKNGKYNIDLTGLSKKLLIDAGINRENIYDSEVDAIKDKRFFSHYSDAKAGRKDRGRFALVAAIK